MLKDEAEEFIYKCLVDNEEKNDPKDKLSRKDIVDILTVDHGIPVPTAYRYFKDTSNLYKWELKVKLQSIARLSKHIQNY